MIPLERAQEIVMSTVFSAGTETVPFMESLNRILAGDVTSDINMPPFDKASMDGFACRRSEIDHELEITETIGQGRNHHKSLYKPVRKDNDRSLSATGR
jgi:molybdopterin molybdotransferase